MKKVWFCLLLSWSGAASPAQAASALTSQPIFAHPAAQTSLWLPALRRFSAWTSAPEWRGLKRLVDQQAPPWTLSPLAQVLDTSTQGESLRQALQTIEALPPQEQQRAVAELGKGWVEMSLRLRDAVHAALGEQARRKDEPVGDARALGRRIGELRALDEDLTSLAWLDEESAAPEIARSQFEIRSRLRTLQSALGQAVQTRARDIAGQLELPGIGASVPPQSPRLAVEASNRGENGIPAVRVMAYGPSSSVEAEVSDPALLQDYVDRWPVTWVNVEGKADEKSLREIGKLFNIHDLAIEDVLSVSQESKVESYDDQQFIVARMPQQGDAGSTEQINLVLGRNFVVTFQDGQPGDPFGKVRESISRGSGKINQYGADYLAYALLDAVVDSYSPVLKRYGETLDQIDEQIDRRPGRATRRRLHNIKKELHDLKHMLWPMRDMLSIFTRDVLPRITDETRLHMRDLYGETRTQIAMIESYHERAVELVNLYQSTVNNRMNERLRFLAVISTIFIPLQIITGIFGMNFKYLPWLSSPWGHTAALALMAAIAGGLLFYFHRKGWLRADND